MRLNRLSAMLIVLGLTAAFASQAAAVPYASSVRNTSGTDWEFILNENAENVTLIRDGNPTDLGALAIGRHTFSMSGFSNWEIKVTNQTPIAAWTPVTNPSSGQHTHFEQTTGVVINRDPSSEFFGVAYVGNSRTNPTASGRSLGDGIYSLTADQVGVNLDAGSFDYAYYAPTFDFDTAQAKNPGFTNDVSTSSTWKMALDASNNLIISDFSDAVGGIKYANPTLTAGGLVLATEGGPFGGVAANDSLALHGSIASKPYVTGSVGVDLTVWALDEDMHQSRNIPQVSGANGNHVWRWDVGSATSYDGAPNLVINTSSLLPTPAMPRTSDARQSWLSTNVGVASNVHFEPTHNKFYMSQSRFDGNEAGLIVTDNNGQLLWSSLQWAIDNQLDGNTGLATGGSNCDGSASCSIQDPFRGVGGGMTLSPDGTELYLQTLDRRSSIRASNPYFGTALGADPLLQGEILVIPLDANGIPDIQVSGLGGTITNMSTISIGAGATNSSRRDLAVDAAGNLYVVDSNPERMFVYTPGGATVATTTSSGAFSVVPFSVGTPGDHDGNGVVDARDYVVWRKSPGDYGNAQGYTDWVANFGSGGGGGNSGDAVGAVPEPASLALVLLGVCALAANRRRGR